MASGAALGAAGGSAWGPIGAGIGAIGGGIVDWIGGQKANDQNWDEFVSNQAWNTQEIANAQQLEVDMSNTAYQRAVRDMKAAGINPMLAVQNGGASTPSAPITNAGTGAAAQNATAGLGRGIGAAASSAMQAMQLDSDLRTADADRVLKAAQGQSALAQAQANTASARQIGEATAQMLDRHDSNRARALKENLEDTWKAANQPMLNTLNVMSQGAGIARDATQGGANLMGLLRMFGKGSKGGFDINTRNPSLGSPGDFMKDWKSP